MADAQLRDRLAVDDFDGPRWLEFAMDAAEYAIAVFMRWLHTGELYDHAARRRRAVRRPARELSYEERLGLVHLIVAHGLAYFRRDALAGGRWRPEGGASLKTYLIGACLLQIKDAFRRWRPDSLPTELADDQIDTAPPWTSPLTSSVADEVVLRACTWDVVLGEDPLTQQILVCLAAGMTYEQAALVIGGGLTEDAACQRVKRLRDKHRHQPGTKGQPS